MLQKAIAFALFVVTVQAIDNMLDDLGMAGSGLGMGFSGGPAGLDVGCSDGACGIPGPVAIRRRQRVDYIPTRSTGFVAPTNVDVVSQSAPFNLRYRTMSSPVNIEHMHQSLPGSFKQTQSVDEPHVRIHTVTKPIIQEVREIIAPQRIIRQQVQPVQEEIQTQIARQVSTSNGAGFAGASSFTVFGNDLKK